MNKDSMYRNGTGEDRILVGVRRERFGGVKLTLLEACIEYCADKEGCQKCSSNTYSWKDFLSKIPLLTFCEAVSVLLCSMNLEHVFLEGYELNNISRVRVEGLVAENEQM
ncbi:hypothetical protein CEXT_44011 [Caerostris extrusa]|uniref:Uncharacterized protein n=1 Tax=Caerostris extrusa TaxID=172846 RepID=A0AAV4WMN3_CAEEX|nr:hypothetical protein CEXT_44011 [Caerostris extrusa]